MILKYKSFSLIELIFIIMILGIVSTIAIPKLINKTKNTTILKGKTDLNIILNGLQQYKTNLILQNLSYDLTSLETSNNKYLFDKILDKPFISQKNKAGYWNKISDTTYRYYISSTDFIEFTYDKTNLAFSCDKTKSLCQEILK